MQTPSIDTPSKAQPSSGETSFAGVLATMASSQEPGPAWSDDELADDVATISYEQALRTHGRLRCEEGVPGALQDSVEEASGEAASQECEAASEQKPLKKASITIRMSAPECAQVRKRAAEAGLTVSAYLRSCTLEVETLRAQVKDALSQLRSSRVAPREPQEAERTSRLQCILQRLGRWLRRFRPRSRAAIGVNPVNPFAPLGN